MPSLDARPISPGFEEPTSREIERRAEFVNLQKDDVLRIAAAKPVIAARVDDYVGTFLEYLAGLEEAAPLFLEPAILQEAKRLKREHLLAMAEGHYARATSPSGSDWAISTAVASIRSAISKAESRKPRNCWATS
jgi:Protoglobin